MVTEHDLPRLFSPDREAENPKDRVGDTKPPLHLIPPSAEILEAVVMGLGARKYGQTLNTRTHHGLGHHAPSDLLRCSQCGDSKSSTEFNRDHRRPHNRRAECRVCQSRYNRELKARKPLYNIWNLMQQRCYNKDNPGYEFYGARGIVVCDRWHTYEAFVEDMSPRPSAKHSIDRMDVNGIYSPENCRWATQQEQVLNLRSNRLIEINGEKKPLAEWGRINGVPQHTVEARIYRYGWDEVTAVTTPSRQYSKRGTVA